MVAFVYTAREHHMVRSEHELLKRLQAFIAKKATRGARFVVHADESPLVARVDSNSWLSDCPSCNAGIAIEPEWGVACCFSCGAVYRNLVVPTPDDRAAIEEVLLARPFAPIRTWLPTESVEDLQAQNLARGLPVTNAPDARRGSR